MIVPEKTIEHPEYHATVRDIPTNDRPRERLQKKGAESLSNSDLIAIILRTGTQRDNAIELASKLLIKYSGLILQPHLCSEPLCSAFDM